MADCIPAPTENQALAPRQSLYGSFSSALALRGGAIVRAPTKLRVMVRRLSMDRRHSPDQIRENPPQLVPGLLDPEQMAAVVDALRVAIVDGARWLPSLAQRRADSSDSDSDSDSSGYNDEGGHPNDQHMVYPLIQSLQAEDSRLFVVPGSAGSVTGLPDARQADGVYSDLLDVNKSEEKYLISFSSGEALWAEEAREKRLEEPKRGAHVPRRGARGPCPWGPRASSGPLLFTAASVSTKNLRHIFPQIYRGGGGGESPLLLRERADPAAPEPPVRGKSTPSSSPLFLGVGGDISINISISIIIITITICKIHLVPLIVCD